MIVKNESAIIVETLEHLHSIFEFDYWVISDTGSTDNTKELIIDYFKNINVPGELLENEWKWFGPSRTDALNAAYNKTDYLLIFDADDRIEGDIILPDKLIADRYIFRFKVGVYFYRPLLINNRKKWEFKGIIHEVLCSLDDINYTSTIEGDYYINGRTLGNFNLDPEKYNKQARILEQEYYKEIALKKDIGLAHRYLFYCAKSYSDGNESDNALIWYKKVVDENTSNWSQEKFYSCIQIGDIYREKNNLEEALRYYIKSIDFDNERIDGIICAINLLKYKKLDILAIALYYKYKNYNKNINSDTKLFLNIDIYKNMDMEFIISIMSYYIQSEHNLGYECCKLILNNKNFSSYNYLQNIKNLSLPNFSLFINKDSYTELYKLLTSLSEYLEYINNNKNTLNINTDDMNIINNLWKLIYDKV